MLKGSQWQNDLPSRFQARLRKNLKLSGKRRKRRILGKIVIRVLLFKSFMGQPTHSDLWTGSSFQNPTFLKREKKLRVRKSPETIYPLPTCTKKGDNELFKAHLRKNN